MLETPRACDYEVDEGGGAFYGPKIDLKIKDAIGRDVAVRRPSSSTSSCPQRFDLEYIGADGSRHRPVMIHRALFGSIERFFGDPDRALRGAFPLWLAPVQARVLTVSEKAEAYAQEIAAALRGAGLRVETDLAADKLGAKIRRAQMEKIPTMLVVGEKDMAARVVSPRMRDGQQLPAMPLDELVQRLRTEAAHPPAGVSDRAATNRRKEHRKARLSGRTPRDRRQLSCGTPHPRARGARDRR